MLFSLRGKRNNVQTVFRKRSDKKRFPKTILPEVSNTERSSCVIQSLVLRVTVCYLTYNYGHDALACRHTARYKNTTPTPLPLRLSVGPTIV